ncbi:unnamed protein product [Rhizopus stolonifer]
MGNIISRSKHIRLDTQNIEETGLDVYDQLACVKRGASVERVSNEFYGKAENLLKQEDAKGPFDYEGTSDGWQVKRHMETASVIIKLGCTGTLVGFDINTKGFIDSAPSHVLIEGFVQTEMEEKWVILLSNVSIEPNSHNFFRLQPDPHIYSCIRLTNTPGGGISRLRCYGQVMPVWKDFSGQYNMASANLGARIVHWTDIEHANKPNILLDDGRRADEGWLTPRSRGNSRNDFVVIQLAATCVVEGIVLDTTGFKGNFPEHVQIEGCQSDLVDPYRDPGTQWFDLLKKSTCFPNNQILYSVTSGLIVSHVKLTLFPDGGLQQIQILGTLYDPEHLIVTKKETEALLEEERIEKELDKQITRDIDDLLLPAKNTPVKAKRKATESIQNSEPKKPANDRKKLRETRERHVSNTLS